MTILEGNVTTRNSRALLREYQKTIKKLPSEIIKTYLVRNTTHTDLWRIITIWHSKEDLEAMRKQGTPKGVLIFRAAGCEPILSIFQIEEQSR